MVLLIIFSIPNGLDLNKEGVNNLSQIKKFYILTHFLLKTYTKVLNMNILIINFKKDSTKTNTKKIFRSIY